MTIMSVNNLSFFECICGCNRETTFDIKGYECIPFRFQKRVQTVLNSKFHSFCSVSCKQSRAFDTVADWIPKIPGSVLSFKLQNGFCETCHSKTVVYYHRLCDCSKHVFLTTEFIDPLTLCHQALGQRVGVTPCGYIGVSSDSGVPHLFCSTDCFPDNGSLARLKTGLFDTKNFLKLDCPEDTFGFDDDNCELSVITLVYCGYGCDLCSKALEGSIGSCHRGCHEVFIDDVVSLNPKDVKFPSQTGNQVHFVIRDDNRYDYCTECVPVDSHQVKACMIRKSLHR